MVWQACKNKSGEGGGEIMWERSLARGCNSGQRHALADNPRRAPFRNRVAADVQSMGVGEEGRVGWGRCRMDATATKAALDCQCATAHI